MSKELIDELRSHAAVRTGYTTSLIDKAADAIESQAREIERLGKYKRFESQYHEAERELAALKAQPSGVVLPELNKSREQWARVDARVCARNNSTAANMYLIQDAQEDIERMHRAFDEIARLNSSTVSAGEQCMCGGSPHTTQCLYEHFLSYSGLADQPTLRYAYFHGADEHCDQSASAGDERVDVACCAVCGSDRATPSAGSQKEKG